MQATGDCCGNTNLPSGHGARCRLLRKTPETDSPAWKCVCDGRGAEWRVMAGGLIGAGRTSPGETA